MSSDDAIEFEGKVVEVLSGGTFKVNVGEGHDVIAKLGTCSTVPCYADVHGSQERRRRRPSSGE